MLNEVKDLKFLVLKMLPDNIGFIYKKQIHPE
jgi:hypothetical protein